MFRRAIFTSPARDRSGELPTCVDWDYNTNFVIVSYCDATTDVVESEERRFDTVEQPNIGTFSGTDRFVDWRGTLFATRTRIL